MSYDRSKKTFKIRIPSDSMLGMAVLGGVAVAVAIAIFGKEKSNHPGEASSAIQAVKVIDGDTIEVNSEKLRLYGIDAPEKGQPCRRNNTPYDCGTASKEHLEFLLSGAEVNCTKKGKDKWGRYVAECEADGEDVSKLMVRHGWAIAYRKYSTTYVEDEKFAQSNRLGMWSKEFSIPSEWRKSDRGDKL